MRGINEEQMTGFIVSISPRQIDYTFRVEVDYF